VRSFDSTLLIDCIRGDADAVGKVRELVEGGERLTTSPVAAAQVLVGAHFRGPGELSRTLEFLDGLEILPFDIAEATEAGRIGAEALRRGTPIAGSDLLVAATARHRGGILVSRDGVFSQVPSLAWKRTDGWSGFVTGAVTYPSTGGFPPHPNLGRLLEWAVGQHRPIVA
jgi:predicted nucleic acid-binding protein